MKQKNKYTKLVFLIGFLNNLLQFGYLGLAALVLMILALFKVLPFYVALILFGLWILIALIEQIRMRKIYTKGKNQDMFQKMLETMVDNSSKMSMDEILNVMVSVNQEDSKNIEDSKETDDE